MVKHLNVALTADQHRSLKVRAANEGLSVSDLVRRALVEHGYVDDEPAGAYGQGAPAS